MAYDMSKFESPDSTDKWLKEWAARDFGPAVADTTAKIMATYGTLIIRRKYELLNVPGPAGPYSAANYDEAETVYNEWVDLLKTAQEVYDGLDSATQIAFFETVLHPVLAGKTVQEIYLKTVLNDWYQRQKRTSTNKMANDVRAAFQEDARITQRYHSLLNGKWNHMMDQIHLGYNNWYWSSIPKLKYGIAKVILGKTLRKIPFPPSRAPQRRRSLELWACLCRVAPIACQVMGLQPCLPWTRTCHQRTCDTSTFTLAQAAPLHTASLQVPHM